MRISQISQKRIEGVRLSGRRTDHMAHKSTRQCLKVEVSSVWPDALLHRLRPFAVIMTIERRMIIFSFTNVTF
jgi:hypothetical protein